MLAYVIHQPWRILWHSEIPFTPDDLWKAMSYIRTYTLFRNPLSMKSRRFGLLLSNPRCVRKLSNAARGKGVYAIEDG
jgi:hypothetical protein